MDCTLDTIRDIKILQSNRGYRFSLDSLLLADFVNLEYPGQIADLGAGSGIIGILLAKRFPSSNVLLIEVQDSLSELAGKNIKINKLDDRVRLCQMDIMGVCTRGIKPNNFDLVISNPPFRKPSSGKVSPYDERAIARHEIKISLPKLIDAAFYLLKGKGRFCFIFHATRLVDVVETLRLNRFEPKRLCFIHSDMNREAKMFLMEATKEGNPQLTIEKPFFIHDKNGEYTEEALRILGC